MAIFLNVRQVHEKPGGIEIEKARNEENIKT